MGQIQRANLFTLILCVWRTSHHDGTHTITSCCWPHSVLLKTKWHFTYRQVRCLRSTVNTFLILKVECNQYTCIKCRATYLIVFRIWLQRIELKLCYFHVHQCSLHHHTHSYQRYCRRSLTTVWQDWKFHMATTDSRATQLHRNCTLWTLQLATQWKIVWIDFELVKQIFLFVCFFLKWDVFFICWTWTRGKDKTVWFVCVLNVLQMKINWLSVEITCIYIFIQNYP